MTLTAPGRGIGAPAGRDEDSTAAEPGASAALTGAGLNCGDCFSYALSATSGEPLLCKGGDFARTDAKLVLL